MVEILDSTLREGEQNPGVSFTIEEKIHIANLLDEFGVDIIEAGHPCVSEDILKGVKEISNQGFNAEILAHSRAMKKDIDAARSCDVDWVGIFFCVSNERLEKQFRMKLNDAVDLISSTIEYAKGYGLKVRYTPEDTVRTDYGSLVKISKAAIEAGVDRISIADTVGAMTPIKMYDFVRRLKLELKIKLNVHCHNDLGLATANSLAAYEAGVTLIDVSVNGIGERVGITSLSELCLALHCLYRMKNNWRLDLLPEISQKVSEFSGLGISPNTPIVGSNAFLHNAGLHVSAVLLDPKYYEIIPAEIVGRRRDFFLGKMAGNQTIKQKLKEMEIKTCDDNILKIKHHLKSKEKGITSNNEIMGLLNNNYINHPEFQ